MAQQEKKKYAGGAPTEREVADFGQQVEKANQSPYLLPNPVFTDNKMETLAMNSGRFPVRPIPQDPYDSMWSLKGDMSRPVIGPNNEVIAPSMASTTRPLPFTNEDVQYLKRKRDAEEFASFLTWEASKYDLSDPATREWFEKRCPSYFQQRESLIEQQIDLAARYAKMRLRGPKTEDDLKIEYLIETDRLSLPKGPIWDPFKWIADQGGIDLKDASAAQIEAGFTEYNKNTYRKGLFNPTKVMHPAIGARVKNPYNLGDPVGIPGTNYSGIYGTQSPQVGNYAANYGPTPRDGSLLAARTALQGDMYIQANSGLNRARQIQATSQRRYMSPGMTAGHYINMPENLNF